MNTPPIKILMVEDSVSLTEVYKAYLHSENYQLVAVERLGTANASLGSFRPDVVLLDIELPDGNGMDFLDECMQLEAPPKVIIMTAHGTSDLAVEAIERGAFDFLTKPFDAARLRVTVDNAARQLRLDRQAGELASLQRDRFGGFLGSSLAMQTVYKTVDALAGSDATGFIVGESGTGKELAAEAIHRHSQRRDKAFIAINCGAIPGDLMESELFGHVKGAFTGASSLRQGAASVADGGTLFLDEICEMSLELQKKLLRFIQTGTFRKVGSNSLEKVDVRFVCATNRDPLDEVRAGRFREDLFYRLHVIPVRMPPLREREGDIVMLAEHFLAQFAAKEGKAFTRFEDDALQMIRRYPWPGNVRQLQNAVQQVAVLNDGSAVTAAMLPEPVCTGHLETGPAPTEIAEATAVQRLAEGDLQRRREIEPLWLVEKKTIEGAISACDGNVNRAAGLLEVAPSTLYRKLQSWKNKSA
ncbi:MAG: sigma-54 dependent transcriptional regulator [Pseudomonadales bacterium]|jgi:DNA-binding NtrC family response regulator|nr:sigma-54 dependent transcriptional regulator [Pseudomonadales bacterium]